MTDLERDRDKEVARNRMRGIEESDWQRSKEQHIVVAKINIELKGKEV